MNQPLAEIFRYNKWANQRLLVFCTGLTEAQLDAQAPGTFGSIRSTLVHLVGGQQTFVLRTKGRQHEGELDGSSPWPGFDALTDIADNSSNDLIVIAEGLDRESEVDLAYMGKRYRYPKSFFLLHAIEHGVEHRTQVTMTVAGLGRETPDLDGWAYADAAGHGSEAGAVE